MGEGARSDDSSYRLHLYHALMTSYFVYSAFYKPTDTYPEYTILASSMAYYVVDLMKMLFNDFVYKVGGYQKGLARVMEYIHHIISLWAICCCTFSLSRVCNTNAMSVTWQKPGPFNPLYRFSIADISTVPLMLWRRGGCLSTFWYSLFAILFIVTRILYHGYVFVPNMYNSCNDNVKIVLIIYQMIQFISLMFISQKWLSVLNGTEEKKRLKIIQLKKEEAEKLAAETAAANNNDNDSIIDDDNNESENNKKNN